MAYDGGAVSEGVQFVKLSGEPIALKVPAGSKMRDVKLDLAKILGGGSVRLIDETGKVLEGNDVLQGTLQVQRLTIAEGEWSELFSAACNGFDENKLGAAIRAAWPGDFVRVGEDPKVDPNHPLAMKYDDEEWFGWQQDTFKILRAAITSSCGKWAEYWFCRFWRPALYSTTLQHIRAHSGTPCNWCEAMAETFDGFGRWICSVAIAMLQLPPVWARRDGCCKFNVAFTFPNSRCFMGCWCWHVVQSIPTVVDLVFQLCRSGIWHWYTEIHHQRHGRLRQFSNAWRRCHYHHAADGWRIPLGFQESGFNFRLAQHQIYTQWDVFQVDSQGFEWTSHLPRWQPPAFHWGCGWHTGCHQGSKDETCIGGLSKGCQETWSLDTGPFAQLATLLDEYRRGRERYPLHFGDGQSAKEHFIKLLEEANSTEPVALRASRAYLDVLFFHPINDGNSRLARLVFDFILTRANVAMGSIDGILLFARSARDVVGAQRLVELVDYRLAKPGEWKDLEDPPEITKENCRDERWFSMGRFPPDNRKFLEG